MPTSLEAKQILERLVLQQINIAAFPTHFSVVIRLRTALNNPDVTVKQLVDIVSAEAMVSTRLIQSANAAVYHGRDPIIDVERAINRIGLSAVKRTALAVAMYQLSQAKELLHYAGLSRALWLNSLYTAAAASVIANELTGFSADEAAFAGLSLNLGAFYLLYQAIRQPALQRASDDVKEALQTHHLDLTSRILSHFDLPDALITATDLKPILGSAIVNVPKTLREVVYAAYVMGQRAYPWFQHEEAPGTLSAYFEQLDVKIKLQFNSLQNEFH